MSSQPPTLLGVAGGELELRYYAGLVWRHRAVIVAAALVGLSLGGLVAFLQVPEYQAAAMVQVDPPTPLFLSVNEALMGSNYWQNSDYYNTQFKILQSRTLGEQVVGKLKLADRPPFKDHPDPGSLFMAHVGVNPIPDSRLVMVQVTHRDPKEAALWANTLADTYIDYSVSSRVESARRAYDWLQEQLGTTRRNMQESQERLLRGYQSQDLFVPEGGLSAVNTSIARLTEDYTAAQSRRIAIEAALKQVADLEGRGQGLEALPQMAADPALATLSGQVVALRAEIARLREKYKPAHPEVVRAQARLDEADRARLARTRQIVVGLQAELGQIRKREDELRGAIDAQKAQAAAQSRKATELEALRKETESNKAMYDVLLQKLQESNIAGSIRANNTSVVERAAVPRSRARPNRQRIAGVGLLAGLLLGVGLVVGRDLLQNTVRDPDDVERYLHLDLLAAVPRYDDKTAHLVTEAYQNLRTALLFARRDEGGQVVLVTGTAPQEGKTTTLLNVGKLLASSGERTLLVDGDLRRAQLHTRLEVPREPGLTDHFVRHEPPERLVQVTRLPNLAVLTAGPLPPNPPAILARKGLGDLLAELRRRYEWILVDSPPLASVTDALLLARHADLVVFVIEHKKVDKLVLRRSVNALRKVTSTVLGAVLNAVDVEAKGSYYSYYYHHRYEGPAEGQEAPDAAPPRG